VDGNDAVAMWHDLGVAVDRAREGGGPTLIDALTYRFYGHILGEDLAYQPEAERNAAIAADPVPAYRSRLISQYGVNELALADIDRRVAAEVDDAFSAALAGPEPDVSSLHSDVVAEVGV
jgi:pyruvate dehydrogenase E1 component alpha subunit